MESNELIGYGNSVICGVLSASERTLGNDTTSLILTILTILSTIVSVAFTIYKWYKKAKSSDSDGGNKITQDEIEDLIDDVKEDIKEGKDKIDNINEKENMNDGNNH